MNSEYGTFKVWINDSLATIDARFKPEMNVCFFNIEKHKDFVNGFKALGFTVKEKNYRAIPIFDDLAPDLTEEVMENIWNEILRQKSV